VWGRPTFDKQTNKHGSFARVHDGGGQVAQLLQRRHQTATGGWFGLIRVPSASFAAARRGWALSSVRGRCCALTRRANSQGDAFAFSSIKLILGGLPCEWDYVTLESPDGETGERELMCSCARMIVCVCVCVFLYVCVWYLSHLSADSSHTNMIDSCTRMGMSVCLCTCVFVY